MKNIFLFFLIFSTSLCFSDCANFYDHLTKGILNSKCDFEIVSKGTKIDITLKLDEVKDGTLFISFLKKYLWNGKLGTDIQKCKIPIKDLSKYNSDFLYIKDLKDGKLKPSEAEEFQNRIIVTWNCAM